jgi:hypothetical protein
MDLDEYNASLMPGFLLFGNKILALIKPLIMFAGPDIIVLLTLVNV